MNIQVIKVNYMIKNNQIKQINIFSFSKIYFINNLEYLFLDDNPEYINYIKSFKLQNILKFNGNLNKYKKIIKNNIQIYINLSFNLMISKFLNKNYNYDEIYLNFLNFSLDCFKNNNLSSNIINLLKIFFDKNTFDNKFRKIVKNLNSEQIECLLYCYKFSLISILGNENSFYYKLLTKDIKNTINNNYIPGVESYQSIYFFEFNFHLLI